MLPRAGRCAASRGTPTSKGGGVLAGWYLLVTASFDGTARVWDVHTGQSLVIYAARGLATSIG